MNKEAEKVDMPEEKKSIEVKFLHSQGWLRDRILIHRQEGPGGVAAVFVGLNGFHVQIPREVECDIPKPLVEVLRHAVPTLTFRDEKNVEYTKDVQRFNFVVIREDVNWEEIMNNEKYAAMNEEYLKSVGKWGKGKK